LGEWSLENLLSEILPREAYHLQYSFRSGNKVDALVELATGRVCVDAKFPLENFRAMLGAGDELVRQKQRKVFLRDVKKRIDEIADRYIVPDEGTLDFALMYIPAENVYYETVISHSDGEPDIGVYSREKKVFAVSPNLLYGYLMIIATGLQGLQIEKNAERILKQLSQMDTDFSKVEEDFQTLGRHLTNARGKYDETQQKLDQFGLRLRSLDAQE
jgi:DNA recombination protein RmuC